jgi:hypothetical protein
LEEQEWEVDHLIICGDIIASYDDPDGSEDFDCLRYLLKTFGWYDSKKCTIMPGSHDVKWMGNFPSNARTVRQRFPKLFQCPVKYNRMNCMITKVIDNVVIIGLDTVTDNPSTSLSIGDLLQGPIL